MILIFDTSIFAYANFYTMSTYLKPEDITSEAIAFKVKSQIEGIAFSLNPDASVILAGESSWNFRKSILPSYKSSRVSKFDGEAVFNFLRPYFDCRNYEGLEADDVMYVLSNYIDDDIVVVSNDDDMRLVLNKNTFIYKYRLDKLIEYDKDILIIEQCLKVCGGCTGDEVPSIKKKRFGKVVVRKLLKDNLADTLQALIDEEYVTASDVLDNYYVVMYDKEIYDTYFDFNDIKQTLCQV